MKQSIPKRLQAKDYSSGPDSSARCAGIYVLFNDGRSVDMLYELEVPEFPHEAQEQLGIYRNGEYTVQIKVHCLALCIAVLRSCVFVTSRISLLMGQLTNTQVVSGFLQAWTNIGYEVTFIDYFIALQTLYKQFPLGL